MDVYWIGEPETGVSVEDVGGKSMNAIRAARLLNGREINGQEITIPDGFAVNGELQEEFLEEQRWKHGFLDRRDAMNVLRPEDVDDWNLPQTHKEELRENYERLEDPVGVRSSGVAEDSDENNFAGRYESVIGITGSDELMEGVSEVLASQFSSRVQQYQMEIGEEQASDLRLLIQEAKNPDVSAVVDSRADSEGRVGFDLNEGLPTTIVDGESIDQAFADLGGSLLGGFLVYDEDEDYFSNPNRDTKHVLEDGELVERSTDVEGSLVESEELGAVVEVARLLEEVSGEPGDRSARDMEVGWNKEDDIVYIFQDRPVPGEDVTEAEELPDVAEEYVVAESQQVSGGPELVHYEDIPAVVVDDSTPNPGPDEEAYNIIDYDLTDLDEELGEYVLITENYNERLHADADPEVVVGTDSGFGGHLINILGNEGVDTEYISFLGEDLSEIDTYDEIGVALNGLEGLVYMEEDN
jgi:hypothetical protein